MTADTQTRTLQVISEPGQCTMTQALGWIEQHMENIELRDQFAGLAMQPMCDGKWPPDAGAPEIARRSYVIAAAMLKARSP